ncbi:DNA ligase 1-like [Patiria miniata]|uniref:Uncharacterized protein n=1 Tax=Patiria miniata TaxID=46514 RepID=A0A914AEQ6_PATMI|nr:DNA ligase 1-like [Patiria miniata]
MASGSMALVDSGLADLDKILQSLEIENKQQQHEIQKEQQQTAAFEAATIEKEMGTKTQQEETARLDEETKAAHQQFCRNKETYESLKNHYLALVLNQETAQKELHELQDKWQVQQAEQERILQHYESIWDKYKAKYEEKALAVELRQWQQQVAQTRERLTESKHKVTSLEAAIQEREDQKKNAPKPFKSLNDWVIQIAKAAVRTRDLRRQKEETLRSINSAKMKIQERKEKQLRLQKEKEEQERKRKLKEAEDKTRQEELERQKQQQLYQEHKLQQLKAQQQQRQQQTSVPTTPQQILPPQSPIFQQPTRRAPPQYIQSPMVRPAAAVPASPLRRPPYLQMPILASPRLSADSASGSSENVPQPFALRMPAESVNKTQMQPQAMVQQSSDAPVPKEAPALPSVSAHERAEAANQRAVPRQDEPITEGRFEVSGEEESGGTDDADESLSEAPVTPATDPTSFQDPGTPGSVMSLPPRSPFDLDTHLQGLQEMAKSPGFSYSFRPMFGSAEDANAHGEVADKSCSNPPTSSSENFDSPFFESFFSGMGGAIQPASNTPTNIFGPSRDQVSSHPTGASIFGRPGSPMDTGHSRPPGGVLSLFGGGSEKADKARNDERGSPAAGFSFNFGGSRSPNVDSSGEGKFSLF